MSLTRTDDRPYKSLCSDLYVDAPNYLAELVCKRKQEKENSGALPIKFWNHPNYKNLYIREVSQAKILLKKYQAKAIIEALNRWESKYILSLRNKKLIPLIEECSLRINESEFIQEETSEFIKPKVLPNKKNIIGLL